MRIVAFVAALMLASPALADCPNIGLKRETVRLITAKGTHSYMVDLAATPDQQACGLMYREAMPRDSGMIFPFKPARTTAFWMRNTPLPLDLIFVGPDGRVVSIGRGKPFSEALIPSGGVTAAVIELNLGEAMRIGLKPGDRVQRGQ
jgi:hypothetical protein